MYVYQSLLLLLVGLAFTNASPAWFYSKGVGNAAPSEVGCLSFTKEYDPYTGQITYRCNTNVKNTHQSVPNRRISDKDSDEDDYLTPEALQSSGRSRNSYSKPMYQSSVSRRFQIKNKNNKPKRPSNSRRNRCPPGQMFQSELDICIDYPIGPSLPPKRPSNIRQTAFDRMLGDVPVRAAAAHQRAPTSLRKYNLKNRCKPNEIYLSEVDICVLRTAAAHQSAPVSVSIPSIRKYNLKNRCKPNEAYLSELDICVLRNY